MVIKRTIGFGYFHIINDSGGDICK